MHTERGRHSNPRAGDVEGVRRKLERGTVRSQSLWTRVGSIQSRGQRKMGRVYDNESCICFQRQHNVLIGKHS
jgi:hypothetical protein